MRLDLPLIYINRFGDCAACRKWRRHRWQAANQTRTQVVDNHPCSAIVTRRNAAMLTSLPTRRRQPPASLNAAHASLVNAGDATATEDVALARDDNAAKITRL
jgi:hypothetical protein